MECNLKNFYSSELKESIKQSTLKHRLIVLFTHYGILYFILSADVFTYMQ